MSSKVSFTIRRPSPVSRATSSGPESDAGTSFKVPPLPRHLARDATTPIGSPLARSEASSPRPVQQDDVIDSSDEDDSVQDELVTGFDKFGVQRANGEKKKPAAALVIPALKNKDWKEMARKRRGVTYVPPSAAAQTGKDGSVGGLGTRDSINSGPVLSGLQIKKKPTEGTLDYEDVKEESEDVEMAAVEEETDDQKALRAILAESTGESQQEGTLIDIIPTPISETDAYKQDVEELPDSATMDDYSRVPVSQFGAALLRGMGWKEGTAATRKPGKGMVEPYLPSSRPALLGIGAKEQEVYDDGSKKGIKNKRPDKRYVPVLKQDRSGTSTPNDSSSSDRRERSRSPRRSAAPSRRSSPDRYGRSERNGDSRRHDDRERRRDNDREKGDSRRYDDSERRRDDDREKDRDRRRDDARDRRHGDDRDKRRADSSRRDDERSERRRER